MLFNYFEGIFAEFSCKRLCRCKTDAFYESAREIVDNGINLIRFNGVNACRFELLAVCFVNRPIAFELGTLADVKRR